MGVGKAQQKARQKAQQRDCERAVRLVEWKEMQRVPQKDYPWAEKLGWQLGWASGRELAEDYYPEAATRECPPLQYASNL